MGNQTTFFDNGYQYVYLNFYVEAAYSLNLRYGDNATDGAISDLKPDTEFSSEVFSIYDENGNKVNKWTVGAWYTLVIKPVKSSTGTCKWLSIYTRAETGTSTETRVMYLKNVSYLKEAPFAN